MIIGSFTTNKITFKVLILLLFAFVLPVKIYVFSNAILDKKILNYIFRLHVCSITYGYKNNYLIELPCNGFAVQ